MPTYDCFVSVIAPIYNDSLILESFVLEVIEVLRENYSNYELILVNDGSQDDTLQKMDILLKKYECIRLISLSRHFGDDVAISAGLDAVIGDFAVVMIPASDPIYMIPQLIEKARNGTDILIGVCANRLSEPLWMKGGANLFYFLGTKIFRIPLIQNSTQFHVLSRQVVNAIIQLQDKHRYLRMLSFYVGYRSEIFTYQLIRRYKKPRTRNFFESFNLALQIIVTNSLRPLRLASYLSLLASLLNAIYIFYITLIYLFQEKVAEGWVTLSFQNAIMFFLISLVLTILCEYVGAILNTAKSVPPYYIANEKNSSVLIADEKRRNIIGNSQNIKI